MSKEFRINKFTNANLYRRWIIKPPLEKQVIDCSQEELIKQLKNYFDIIE